MSKVISGPLSHLTGSELRRRRLCESAQTLCGTVHPNSASAPELLPEWGQELRCGYQPDLLSSVSGLVACATEKPIYSGCRPVTILLDALSRRYRRNILL